MFANEIRIGRSIISPDSSPYLVAEVSANHNNDIDRAKAIVCAAAESGANAVKFQTYTPDTITLESSGPDFLAGEGIWEGKTLYELYQQGSLPWEWHQELFELAKSLNLDVISSPFDETAVDFLLQIGVDALKIASFEIVHIPLIRKCAASGLPVIISSGMATEKEIEEALDTVAAYQSNVILLHCVSSYPADPEKYSIRRVRELGERFGCLIGLSDHCTTNEVASASVLYGSVFIEKHFTLDRTGGGLDDSFSLEPSGLEELRRTADTLYKASNVTTEISDSEQRSLQYRRSIYASKPILRGQIFTKDNLKVVRPGYGLHPRYFEELLGKKAIRDIGFASPITDRDLGDEIL